MKETHTDVDCKHNTPWLQNAPPTGRPGPGPWTGAPGPMSMGPRHSWALGPSAPKPHAKGARRPGTRAPGPGSRACTLNPVPSSWCSKNITSGYAYEINENKPFQ